MGVGCWVMGDDECILLGVRCWVLMVTIVEWRVLGDNVKQNLHFINIHHLTPITQFVKSKLACARQVTSGPFSGLSSR